jgi:hypothetical protein
MHLAPVYADRLRRGDAETDLVPFHRHHGDPDGTGDNDLFPGTPRQDQHDITP